MRAKEREIGSGLLWVAIDQEDIASVEGASDREVSSESSFAAAAFNAAANNDHERTQRKVRKESERSRCGTMMEPKWNHDGTNVEPRGSQMEGGTGRRV